MPNKKRIKSEIFMDDNIFGGEIYSISIDVTNLSDKDISNLYIEPIIKCGKQIKWGIDSCDTQEFELSQLENKKTRLINEMEKLVLESYEKKRRKSIGWWPLKKERFFNLIFDESNLLLRLNDLKKVRILSPSYDFNEAFTIDDWNDVERLEKDIINNGDGYIKDAFNINKNKLEIILEKINSKNSDKKNLEKGIPLSAGQTVTFSFKFKSPVILTNINKEIQFRISYKDIEKGEMIYSSAKTKIQILASKFSVPMGSSIGSMIGYFIKLVLLSSNSQLVFEWETLIGTMLLGIVIGITTYKKYNTANKIAVEDFNGGLIIGALAGIFSKEFIEKLKLFVG